MVAKKKKADKSVADVGTRSSKRQPVPRGFALWLTSPWRAVAIVFVVSIALYANTIGHEFVWDDLDLIEENQAVKTLNVATVEKIFTQDFWRVVRRGGGYYRPLVTLSYHVNYALFHGNPAGFHWVNVFWNAVTCVLIFAFVFLLFKNVVMALVTALLFAAHPVHTEAVAWVSGRTDVLATLWSLVSLCCYVLARRRRSVLLLAGSLVAFTLALFSKEVAACVPLIVTLLEVGPFQRTLGPGDGRRARRSLLHPVLFFGVLVFYLLLRRHVIGTTMSTYNAYAPGALGYIALPFSVFAGYVYKVLFPVKLSAEFALDPPTSFEGGWVIAGFVLAAAVVWLVWRYRRRPDIVLGAGIFVLGLGPVMNVIPIGEIAAERFLYLPSLGLALILGGLFASALSAKYPVLPRVTEDTAIRWRIPSSRAGTLVAVLVVVIVAYAGKTVARNPVWKSDEVLFTTTVKQEPNNPRAHANVANVARRKGDIAGAIRSYQKSLELNPAYPDALSNLAGIYVERRQFDKAFTLIQRAIAAWPDNAKLVSNLGSLYYETKQYDKAEIQFKKALELNPDELRAHFNLGLIRLQQNRPALARPHFERALRGGPEFYVANYYLAVIENAAGNRDKARQYARRFLSLHGKNDRLRQKAQAIAGMN